METQENKGVNLSFETPQQSASAEAARGQATRSSQLADVSLPQLSSILSRIQGDLSANQIAPSVQSAFGAARTGINQDFATANKGEQAYIPQAFAQAGGIYNTNQMADAKLTAAQNLEFERRQAMKRLDFQEAEAGLTQYNSLLNLLGSGVGTGLNLATGFSGTQSQAISGLPQQSTGWGAISGAMGGASIGAQFGGGYGAILGALAGGIGGYASAGG